jgi:DDE superfamily endonuclease
VFFVDEAGVRSDYHGGTTWAPVGQTPTVTAIGTRFGLNTISAISAQGALRFSVFTGTFTAAGFIDFLRRLLHDAAHRSGGPVFVIVDGHPVHRAQAVTDFVDSPAGRCGCTGCRPTLRSSTRTNGCGTTSSTTAWLRPPRKDPSR